MTVPDTNSNSPNNSNGLDPSESPPMLNGDRPNGKPTSQEVVILPSSFLLLICYSDDASFCVSAFQTIFFILSLISIYAAFFEPGLEFEGRTTDPQWKFREKNWLIFFAKVGLVMNAMHGFMLCKEFVVATKAHVVLL
ncbi:hypothetical protein I204_07031 [Kwoniella mangroviensis CBS 8886]|nr:hypothetical protein I204_07031 [Kwoniella mangroviensis CBS 8886]